MSPEKQRVAIAEACGWKKETRLPKYERVWINPDGFEVFWLRFADDDTFAALPDYLNDLNAMHEAEKACLKNDALLWHRYAANLDSDYVNQPYTVGATAAQRAEALLRTINKWENE